MWLHPGRCEMLEDRTRRSASLDHHLQKNKKFLTLFTNEKYGLIKINLSFSKFLMYPIYLLRNKQLMFLFYLPQFSFRLQTGLRDRLVKPNNFIILFQNYFIIIILLILHNSSCINNNLLAD